MADPEPGSGGVPYTHREIYLAAPNYVGKGLDTFAEVGDSALQSKHTFKEIVADFDTLVTVRSTEKLWNELVKSEVVKQLAEDEFTVEYVAKNAPDIAEGVYQDVQQLTQYSDLASVSSESIEWLLNVDMTHRAIWNDVQLYNRLLKNNKQWMDYFVNLTTFGDPMTRLDEDTKIQLALHAVGQFQNDPYVVFSDQMAINTLLKQSNPLSSELKSDHGVPITHDGFIRGRPNNRNLGGTGTFRTERWRSSQYSNSKAAKLLDESYDLRKIIAQGKLGLQDPTFEFTELFDGTHMDNFWEFDWDYEFIKVARDETKSGRPRNNNNDWTKTRKSNIDTSTNVRLVARSYAYRTESMNHNDDRLHLATNARLQTHNFDVANRNSVTVSIDSGSSHTQHKREVHNSDRNEVADAKSTVTVGVGNRSKTWRAGEDPTTTTFDISNDDTIRIYMRATSAADSDGHNNYEVTAKANSSVDVTDISFDVGS